MKRRSDRFRVTPIQYGEVVSKSGKGWKGACKLHPQSLKARPSLVVPSEWVCGCSRLEGSSQLIAGISRVRATLWAQP